MKWLITGGAGFIGTNLALHLIEAGDTCLITDNFHRPGSRLNRIFLAERCHAPVAWLDVRFADQVNAVFDANSDIDVVAHLAGQVSLVASIEDPRYDFDTNALGTFNVLDAARRYAPQSKLIFSSTNKVYGDLAAIRYTEAASRYSLPDFPLGLPESLPIELHGGYSCSKGSADNYVRDYRRIYGLKTVSLRQSSIYGGNQYATEDQGWIAWFVQMGVQASGFGISGNGKQVRDLLDISDLCACFMKISRLQDDSAAWGEAFNIGGGSDSSLSLLELFDLLKSNYHLPMTYTSGPPRTGDQKVFIADTAKARRLFDWERQTNIESGLDQMVSWSRAQWG